jgi:hypothetical protein
VFVKQNGHYRHNPLYDSSGLLGKRLKRRIDSLSTVRSFDWWHPEMTPVGSISLKHPQVLWKGYEATIRNAIAAYNSMLAALVKIPDMELAAEVADLIYESEVRDSLMAFARAIWDRRKGVRLRELDGREIRFTIRTKRRGKSSAKKTETG